MVEPEVDPADVKVTRATDVLAAAAEQLTERHAAELLRAPVGGPG